MDDKSKLIDQIAGLLGGTNGAQNISSILQGLSGPQPSKNTEPVSASAPAPSPSPAPIPLPSLAANNSNFDIQKIKNIYDSIASDNDPRINLLTALLPYMGERRSGRLQNAVKAIKMTKIVGILGSIDKL